MASYEIVSHYYSNHKPEAIITWTVTSGPVAGISLVDGKIATLPEHGKVVVFSGYRNAEALKALIAKRVLKKGQDVTVVVAGKPELAALVAEAEVAVAAELARITTEAETLEPTGLTYEVGCDGPDTWRLLWPAGASQYAIEIRSKAFPLSILKARISHGDVEGIAAKTIPANMATYGGWEVDRAGMETLFALANNRESEAASKKAEARQAKNLAVAAKQSEAATTGQPVLIERWTEDCDGSAAECNLDACARYAMPDGSTTVRRIHTH